MGCLRFTRVSAFTTKKFEGNPAGVCFVPYDVQLDESKMLEIAREVNLSETAFVTPRTPTENSATAFSQASEFNLRWFTPQVEVALCGHATLATRAALSLEFDNSCEQVTFHTLSGPLQAKLDSDSRLITLDFPANPSVEVDREDVSDIVKEAVGDWPVSDIQYSETTKKLVIVLEESLNYEVVKQLCPDGAKLIDAGKLAKLEVRGVSVTKQGGPSEEYDFCSRYFAPWVGIPEDPVNGSSHTILTLYWASKLRKRTLTAHQSSQRSGCLTVGIKDENKRVSLAGFASIVFKGDLFYDE